MKFPACAVRTTRGRTAEGREKGHASVAGERGDILVPVRPTHEVDDNINALLVRNLLGLLEEVLRLVVDRVRGTVGHLQDEINLVLRRRGRRHRVPAPWSITMEKLTGV